VVECKNNFFYLCLKKSGCDLEIILGKAVDWDDLPMIKFTPGVFFFFKDHYNKQF